MDICAAAGVIYTSLAAATKYLGALRCPGDTSTGEDGERPQRHLYLLEKAPGLDLAAFSSNCTM